MKMASNLQLATVVVAALVCLQLASLSHTQKTAQRWSSTGSNQQSVYGGYGSGSAQPVAAPVAQKGRQTSQQQWSSNSVSRQPVNRPQQPQPQQQQQVYQQQESSASYDSSSSSSSSQAAEADAEPASYGAVNGQPGKDFPNYARVPKTSFSCDGLPYEYGMYADEETGCQAYHLCYNGRKESFLCGTGTVFNQRILHCDYWYSVDCGKSSQYYSSNAYMGSSQPEPGPAEANAAPSQQQQQQSASNSYSRANNRPAAAPSSFRQPQQSSYSRNTQQQVQQQESY